MTDSKGDLDGAKPASIPEVHVDADTPPTPEMMGMLPGVAPAATFPVAVRITGSRFGDYDQLIGEQQEVGYRPLLGASDGSHGWNMPPDFATDELVQRVRGRVLDIGCGDGSGFALRALRAGAEVVALDINRDHLEHVLRQADKEGFGDGLTPCPAEVTWWRDQAGLDEVVARVGKVDMIVARQVLQFGTAETVANVLRFADDVLSDGGELWTQNMSPYLQYLADVPSAEGGPEPQASMIDAVLAANRKLGEDLDHGRHTKTLADIVERVPLVRAFTPFAWFDESLLDAAVRLSGRPLAIQEQFYFSPARIWVRNKLVVGREEWQNRELHVGRVARRNTATSSS